MLYYCILYHIMLSALQHGAAGEHAGAKRADPAADHGAVCRHGAARCLGQNRPESRRKRERERERERGAERDREREREEQRGLRATGASGMRGSLRIPKCMNCMPRMCTATYTTPFTVRSPYSIPCNTNRAPHARTQYSLYVYQILSIYRMPYSA